MTRRAPIATQAEAATIGAGVFKGASALCTVHTATGGISGTWIADCSGERSAYEATVLTPISARVVPSRSSVTPPDGVRNCRYRDLTRLSTHEQPVHRGTRTISARDVELAIRAHDYYEAMRVLHQSMESRDGRKKLLAEIWLLTRPSIAIAAAIVDDEQALREIEEMAVLYATVNPDVKRDAVARTRANAHLPEMVRWIRAAVLDPDQGAPVSRAALDATAKAQRYKTLPQALRMLERHGVLHEQDGLVAPGRRPDDRVLEGVPFFHEYFATHDSMDEAQLAFYENTFKPAFVAGQRIDLGRSVSYGFVVLIELVKEHGHEDLLYLREIFQRAVDFYPRTALARHAHDWVADTYFLAGDYQAGYDLLAAEGRIPLDMYIGMADTLIDTRVTGQMAMGWTTAARLRPYGVRHLDAVLVELERTLDEEHSVRGRSFVLDLWDALAIQRGYDEPAPPWVTDLLGEDIGHELHWMQLYGDRPWDDTGGLGSFRGLLGPETPAVVWPSQASSGLSKFSTYGFSHLLRDWLHKQFREAENTVRQNNGVARIGEGWVSETELYHRLRDTFIETKVVHQGRPLWLRPQSLDVMFPEWNIAIEYQGAQHTQPVERFGGESAFKTQLSRDQRKRELCAAHGHTLIEVFPDYNFDEVVAQIRSIALTKSD